MRKKQINASINQEEEAMVKLLQEKHSLNVQSLFRKFIRQTYDNLENGKQADSDKDDTVHVIEKRVTLVLSNGQEVIVGKSKQEISRELGRRKK